MNNEKLVLASTQLGSQSFNIRLDNKPRVETPILQNLLLILGLYLHHNLGTSTHIVWGLERDGVMMKYIEASNLVNSISMCNYNLTFVCKGHSDILTNIT